MSRPVLKQFAIGFGYGELYPPQLKHLTIDGRHHGFDYLTPKGTPLFSPVDGVVYLRDYLRGFGLTFWIKFWVQTGLIKWETYRCILAHLENITTDLRVGEKIKKMSIIGATGETSTIYADKPTSMPRPHPHLHAEVQKLIISDQGKTWKPVDPGFVFGNV